VFPAVGPIGSFLVTHSALNDRNIYFIETVAGYVMEKPSCVERHTCSCGFGQDRHNSKPTALHARLAGTKPHELVRPVAEWTCIQCDRSFWAVSLRENIWARGIWKCDVSCCCTAALVCAKLKAMSETIAMALHTRTEVEIVPCLMSTYTTFRELALLSSSWRGAS
jgi:hypothetical protein